ncbi:restriction endonuclease subunit S [Novosphingobium sp.]|uniref:restriction endonuclease subunit S n=1 Tax=Novosphingobium sp. TaxID=1874826 RepID=UPI00286E9A1E|nr:restriction endonuclease subunit S [Novosphingobium sp.]
MADPTPWLRGKLGDFFTISREKGEEDLPMLSVTMRNGLVRRDSIDRKMDSELEDGDHLRVRPGDIAYNMMRMWQGASGLATGDGIVSPAYVVVRPKKTVDPLFASYWFKSERMIYLFWAYSYGLTNDRLRLYGKDFTQIPVELPSLPEQQWIAEIISDFDRAIDITDALVGLKQSGKRALMQQVFAATADLAASVPSGWTRMRCDKLAKIVGGSTPDTAKPEHWGGDIPWCTPTDITGLSSRYITSTARSLTQSGVSACSTTILPAGSIVLCSRASVGESAINTVPMCTNQGFQSLVPNEPGDLLFLYYMLRACQRRLIRFSAGSTFLEFPGHELAKMQVAVPGPNMREKIGRVFATLDDEIDLLRAQATALRDQRRGAMKKLLAGDVTEQCQIIEEAAT